jgi:hypothetical protein
MSNARAIELGGLDATLPLDRIASHVVARA